MKLQRLLMVLPLLLILGVTDGAAQSLEQSRWWQSIDIGAALQLTPEEIAQLNNAFDATQLRMIELQGNRDIEEAKLRALLERPELDENGVYAQHHKVREARNLVAEERLSFLITARKLIGRDRFLKLLDIRDLLRRNRHQDKIEPAKQPQ
ncbi:MAG: hypothetical protein M0036_24105 [Desulfobacteraceae bacterium]|nr:hypothetical protein [Desulfobacteraceae bacterium]